MTAAETESGRDESSALVVVLVLAEAGSAAAGAANGTASTPVSTNAPDTAPANETNELTKRRRPRELGMGDSSARRGTIGRRSMQIREESRTDLGAAAGGSQNSSNPGRKGRCDRS